MHASNGAVAAAFAGRSLTVLDGLVHSEPQRRSLPSGDVLEFDVSTLLWAGGSRKMTVTVVTTMSDAALDLLHQGDRVVVIGAARRRFYRAGGATIARTEVEASKVVTGNVRARRTAIANAFAWFTDQG